MHMLPEELLARILALALLSPRPDPRSPVAPLLVSRQFLRIASPLFYHTLHLRSPNHTARALDTLARHPALATAVRRVIFAGIWRDCTAVLALCDGVRDIDICLDGGPAHHASVHADQGDVDAEAFCRTLERRHSIIHLTIRKDPAVYLTHSRPVHVLKRLAHAVHHWPNLETVHFAFRVSSSPSTLPLARALSAAPCLRSMRAQLPAVWNNFLLVISTNPHLERVMLYPEPVLGPTQSRPTVVKGGYFCEDIEHAVLGTGLYMTEAKKHARLSELIKSGTSIIRTRAHTTIASSSMVSAGGTPLGPTRAKELADGLVSGREAAGQPFNTTRRTHAQDI